MRTNGRRGNGDGQLFADHLGVGWSSFRLSKTYVNADKYKVDKDTTPEDLPSLSYLRGAFGAMFG